MAIAASEAAVRCASGAETPGLPAPQGRATGWRRAPGAAAGPWGWINDEGPDRDRSGSSIRRRIRDSNSDNGQDNEQGGENQPRYGGSINSVVLVPLKHVPRDDKRMSGGTSDKIPGRTR